MRRPPRDYAERTLHSPYWIVRFPHQRRHSEMARLVAEAKPRRILDYGAGDGEFLLQLYRSGMAGRPQAVAYEPPADGANLSATLADRLGGAGLAGTVEVVRDRADLEGPFDFVVCMGVLEHLPAPARYDFYGTVRRVLAPGGTVAIDVPVEIGPALLLKNVVRRLLKKDGQQYRLDELVPIALGRRVFDPRRYTPEPAEDFIVYHVGFDHRLLREELASQFTMVDQIPTPLRWLPVACNQEVLLVLTVPPGPATPAPADRTSPPIAAG